MNINNWIIFVINREAPYSYYYEKATNDSNYR